jgi:hypothetical protein
MPASETFWEQIGTFNEVTFPVQILLLVLAIVLTFLMVFRSGNVTDILIKVFLFIAFVWNGIVFFLIFAWSMASMVFSALFIIVAILFFIDIFKKRIRFQFPSKGGRQYITTIFIILVFLYPLAGVLFGRYYPYNLMPMSPSPLVVFAISLMSAALPHVDRKVYVVLLIWAILYLPVGLGMLGCYEDCILLVAGIYGLVALVTYWTTVTARHRFF